MDGSNTLNLGTEVAPWRLERQTSQDLPGKPDQTTAVGWLAKHRVRMPQAILVMGCALAFCLLWGTLLNWIQ